MKATIPLEISPSVCFLGAVLLLLLPFQWLLGVLLAALLHEAGHLLALHILRARVVSIRIGCRGAEISVLPLLYWQELLAALAGPVSGLLAVFTFPCFPCFAAAALIQSVWNLLPVYPLDGGRVLRCTLQILGLERFIRVAEGAALCVMLFTGTWLSFRWNMGSIPVIFLLCMLIGAVDAKFPCKRKQKRLQ